VSAPSSLHEVGQVGGKQLEKLKPLKRRCFFSKWARVVVSALLPAGQRLHGLFTSAQPVQGARCELSRWRARWSTTA